MSLARSEDLSCLKHSHRTATIRELNDAFRTTFVGGRIVITSGVAALGSDGVGGLLELVKSYNAFTADNDPHGEHDFGRLEHGGSKYFWKIDYFDPSLEWGSEDPADINKTVRVLTLMLLSEY